MSFHHDFMTIKSGTKDIKVIAKNMWKITPQISLFSLSSSSLNMEEDIVIDNEDKNISNTILGNLLSIIYEKVISYNKTTK